jgi:hypothetical protein
MATVDVVPGVCGMKTTVRAESEDMQNVSISIESDCSQIKAMEKEIKDIDAFAECFAKIGDGQVYKAARKYCKHAACPVPSAILKSAEVACGLSLPRDVHFIISS